MTRYIVEGTKTTESTRTNRTFGEIDVETTTTTTKSYTVTMSSSDHRAALEHFRDMYKCLPDAVSVDENQDVSWLVMGACEGCERILLASDKYGTDPDGGCLCCPDCGDA